MRQNKRCLTQTGFTNVQLRLLGMSRDECSKFSNVLANIAAAIFRVKGGY
jgi:hypothetical protein